MRLTTRTTLALRTLMVCATNPDRIVRKSDVATLIAASENHLAQVVNQLGQTGFITTLRGRHGGFILARSPDEISIGALFRAVEGELPFIECATSDTHCPLKGICRVSGHLARAVEAFYATLDPVTLQDLIGCNASLEAVLSLENASGLAARALCTQRRTEAA